MIEARVRLPHPPEQVFAFLSDLRDHWRLEDAFIELGDLGLWARVERASVLDRLLLAVGGRRWLAGGFRRAVSNLFRVLDAP